MYIYCPNRKNYSIVLVEVDGWAYKTYGFDVIERGSVSYVPSTVSVCFC